MVRDLHYFHECDLNKQNLKNFYESLPHHLQSIFKASLHAKISWENVLQGYRGPSNMCNNGSGDSGELNPSNGIQEIKFRWAFRKDVNWIPIFGPLIYGTERPRQSFDGDSAWSSLYFDSNTGECLSHDRNEAVEMLRSRTKEGKAKQKGTSFSRDITGQSAEEYQTRSSNCNNNDYTQRTHYQNYGSTDNQNLFSSYERDSEIYASHLFEQGKLLFREGRFGAAKYRFGEASQTSRVNEHRYLHHNHWKAALAEQNAMEFNSSGDLSFQLRKYEEAKDEYEKAFSTSEEPTQRRLYNENIDKAQAEIHANYKYQEGNRMFSQGRYKEAEIEYQAAIYLSKVHAYYYKCHWDKAKREVEAANLNDQGNNLFKQEKYNESHSKYQQAYNTSQTTPRDKYQANMMKAQVEIDAINLNSQGDNYFNHENFSEAQIKYQQAYNKSQVNTKKNAYAADWRKARAEIDAINLNSQGDNFFTQGKCEDALKKYQEAYNKSQIITQKNLYDKNIEKVQDALNKLKRLDGLWRQAWNAENDEKSDRSEEAKEIFCMVLNESTESLGTYAGNNKFEQYKVLAAMKIEGNKLFNQGLKSQQNGITLFQGAQELEKQQKYVQAYAKFKEAKTCFQKALEKFERGCKSDQRFKSCVEIAKEHIGEVENSIKIIGQCMISSGLGNLNLSNSDNHSNVRSQKYDAAGNNINYSEHM